MLQVVSGVSPITCLGILKMKPFIQSRPMLWRKEGKVRGYLHYHGRTVSLTPPMHCLMTANILPLDQQIENSEILQSMISCCCNRWCVTPLKHCLSRNPSSKRSSYTSIVIMTPLESAFVITDSVSSIVSLYRKTRGLFSFSPKRTIPNGLTKLSGEGKSMCRSTITIISEEARICAKPSYKEIVSLVPLGAATVALTANWGLHMSSPIHHRP